MSKVNLGLPVIGDNYSQLNPVPTRSFFKFETR
ncbi:hypothetical protein J560_4136, partial [Acinetobacter baumannii 855125]